MKSRFKPNTVTGLTLGLIPCLALAIPADLTDDRALATLAKATLEDAELGEMRGRYVLPNHQILYFGLEMVSTWSSPDGLVLTAGAQLNLDYATTSLPRVTFVPTATIERQTPSAPIADTQSREVHAGGLNNTTGLVQGIQVAGDYNQALNRMTVELLDARPKTDLAPTMGTESATAARDGAQVSAQLAPDQLTVRLTIDGQGSVQQAIRGMREPASGGQGAVQLIQLLGDQHQASNVMRASVLLKEPAQSEFFRQSVGLYLDSLRGM
ncbi:MAG: hypothetical protein ACFCUG_12510 [Thiotrichales bacterium]